MFKKILLPLDGSANAERALPWVKGYAALSKTPVVLVQVLPRIYPIKGMPFGAAAGESRRYLEGVERDVSALGIPVEIALPSDPVAQAIVDTAVGAKCNLIVMTTRGASKVVRWLLGGVTEQVMRLSPMPVLVIRSQTPPPGSPRPGRILAPVDGTPFSKEALAWAERLADFHQAPVEMLHVRQETRRRPPAGRPSVEEIGRSAARLSRELRNRGIPASFRLEEGDPAQEILKACRPTDLVVMSSHGRAGFKHWVLGSVAEKVIHGSPAPVFICKKRAPGKTVPERGRPSRISRKS